jgi:oxygen-independent coproporphyrinogen-3 oxidase
MAQGLYVHIPFCESICTYCDFPKTVVGREVQSDYVTQLVAELQACAPTLADVETVYIGGGTPSHLAADDLIRVFNAIADVVDLGRVREFTVEANPGDIDDAFVRLLRDHAVDRISLGVQSGQERLLRLMGRDHSRTDVVRAVDILHERRFFNVNLDFIYSLPGETEEELAADIDFACSLQPTHLSFYSLILEPRTILWHERKKGRVALPDEETEAAMFETVTATLPRRGYGRYEVSNFSLPGFESKHNLLYWNVREYLGVGMGAHSQVEGRRFHNHPTLHSYTQSVRKTGFGGRIEDPCDLVQEACILGLRKASGIDLADVWCRFHADVLRRYPRLYKNAEEGLLTIDDRSVRLTDRGLILMNYVEKSFA